MVSAYLRNLQCTSYVPDSRYKISLYEQKGAEIIHSMEIDDPTPLEHPTFGISIPDETIKLLIRTHVKDNFDTLNVS